MTAILQRKTSQLKVPLPFHDILSFEKLYVKYRLTISEQMTIMPHETVQNMSEFHRRENMKKKNYLHSLHPS
jgi:hypothetical protein